MLRLQLVNKYLGELILQGNNDPIDLADLQRIVGRGKDNMGIVVETIFGLQLIKEGRDFVRKAFYNYGGPDAVVLVNVFQINENTHRSEFLVSATVVWDGYDEDEVIVRVATEKSSFERTVLNKIEIDVDMEATESDLGVPLINAEPVVIPLHSRVIVKESKTTPNEDEGSYLQPNAFTITIPNGAGTFDVDAVFIGGIANDADVIEGLENITHAPWGWTELGTSGLANGFVTGTESDYVTRLTAVPSGRVEKFNAKESGIVDVLVKMTLKHKFEVHNTGGDVDVGGGNGALGGTEVNAWAEYRKADGTITNIDKIGEWVMPFVIDSNDRESDFETFEYALNGVIVEPGDKIYVYLTYRVFGNDYDKPAVLDGILDHDFTVTMDEEVSIYFRSETTTTPSNCNQFLVFEAMRKCLQYYTGQADPLVSTLLGRTDLGYAEDGIASLIGICKGNNIKGLDKTIGVSFKYLHELLNSQYCTAFGFETDANGVTRVRYEQLDYFFDNTEVISLGSVGGVKKTVRFDMFHNQIIFGFNGDIDVKEPGGVEAFNTLRKVTTPIKNCDSALDISTSWKTDGVLIEYQRRLVAEPSKDGKFDDDLFAITLVRDGGGYKPKTDEGYALITGVTAPETGYNYDFAPMRALARWGQFFASSLTFCIESKLLKFSSGSEGNVELVTQLTGEDPVAENGMVDLTTVTPIWEAIQATFNLQKFDTQLADLVFSNPLGYVSFVDYDGNTFKGFLPDKGFTHTPDRGSASFVLLKKFDR